MKVIRIIFSICLIIVALLCTILVIGRGKFMLEDLFELVSALKGEENSPNIAYQATIVTLNTTTALLAFFGFRFGIRLLKKKQGSSNEAKP